LVDIVAAGGAPWWIALLELQRMFVLLSMLGPAEQHPAHSSLTSPILQASA
jgi:hypothetical protein